MAVMLIVRGGRHEGQEIRVGKRKKYYIGRAEDCQLRANTDSVSRHHCALMIEEPDVLIRDMGSTNGTYVNGERINGSHALNNGDILAVGALKFEVVITTLKPRVADDDASIFGAEEADPSGDTHILNQAQLAALDLAGPAPRLPHPVSPPRAGGQSAIDRLRNGSG